MFGIPNILPNPFSLLFTINQMSSSYSLYFHNDDAVEVGLDEAGRGCLFGRLYVGAVVFAKEEEDFFDHGATLQLIKDSKVLTPRRRAILYDYIRECALDRAVAFAEATEVDEFNVLAADMRCMHRALDALVVPVDRILVDGDHWRPWRAEGATEATEAHVIVDGDAQFLSIAAAGILAKVARDRWVEEVCAENPAWDAQYGLLSNKGYGTAAHMAGLREHGVTEYHRRSFAPVREALGLPVVGIREKKRGVRRVWTGED
jgi:ribonuclease HII